MKFEEKLGKKLKYLVFYPKNIDTNKEYNVVFFMHGYGDSMNGISGVIEYLSNDNVYVFLNAPFELIFNSIQTGYYWYQFPLENFDEFVVSQNYINESIDEFLEDASFKIKKIFLGGFSQGGIMTLHNNFRGKINGLFIIGSRMYQELENEIVINNNTKIFLSHGTNDEVLNIEEGRKIKSFIETKNLTLDYHEFNIGHQIIPDQMFELNKWIEQI